MTRRSPVPEVKSTTPDLVRERASRSVCIHTHSHLCRNPRVVKEARALRGAGYRVSVVTTVSSRRLREQDATLLDAFPDGYVTAVDLTRGGWGRFRIRAERRLATELVSHFGVQTARALGYGYAQHLRTVQSVNAELTICHQELPTVVGVELLRRGRRVAFDFEDWYSEDLLPEARRRRPLRLLQDAEAYALANSPLTYTTSEAMAAEMARRTGAPAPRVLRNAFPREERRCLDGALQDRRRTDRISLHWYSQTVGPGRGLEELASALAGLDVPYELHLRGHCLAAYRDVLTGLAEPSANQEIVFHPLVHPHELLSRVAEHDVGLALESNVPPSRDLTITNKILHYLLGGLAVLATPTRGQTEVASMAGGAVHLVASPSDLVRRLTQWATCPASLREARRAALSVATTRLCWEAEAPHLVGWVDDLLGVGT